MIRDDDVIRTCVLPERLDLSTVSEVCADLLALDGPDIVIDAGNLRHLGALGAELLLSARRSALARGGRLIVSPRSEAFERTIAEMGLGDILAEAVSCP